MKNYTFKLWNDEDLTYNQQLKLSFAQCDKNTNMSWAELLRLTSDGAVEDFNMRGISWDLLVEEGIIFVVSRVSYHIYKMPKAEQLITLRSWEEAAQGPLFVRRYQIIDTETQEVLINSSSLWTIINFKTRKIIPAKSFSMRPAPTLTTDYDGIKPGKISSPENMEKLGSHTIKFSDMDSNGHANNSKYMNFVIDVLPAEFQDKNYTDLRINYSKEAVMGDVIDLFGSIDEEAKKITVIGKIEENICFETELYW